MPLQRAVVYDSVRLVSRPAVLACSSGLWLQVSAIRQKSAQSEAMRQGLRSSIPCVAAAWLRNPKRQPSKLNDLSPHRLRCLITRRSRQYMHARGHSMAIRPPFARHRSATRTKFYQSLRYTARCCRILALVAGPSIQFRCWYGDPPVQGMAPNSNVGIPGSVTAAIARSSPGCVVRSCSMVSLITSQSAGACCPIPESAAQQNSTIRRAKRGLVMGAGAAGPEPLTPLRCRKHPIARGHRCSKH